MSKLIWRLQPVPEVDSGAVSETEVARIEREDFAVSETLGRTLDERKTLTAAIQAEIAAPKLPRWGNGSAGASTAGQSS